MSHWDSVTSMASSTKDKTPEKPESKPRVDQKDAVGDRMAAETDAVGKKNGAAKPEDQFKSKQVNGKDGEVLAPEVTIDDGNGNGKTADAKAGKPEAAADAPKPGEQPKEAEPKKPEDPKRVELRHGLESESPADRAKAAGELLKHPEKLGAEDIKALAQNLSPEALKAIGALPEAEQAKLKAALLKELETGAKAKPTDAASQRQYERAFEGIVALGGRQALKDMGFKLEENPNFPNEFSLKTENGSDLRFKKEANDTIERLRLTNRPNGGFHRFDYDADGTYKGSFEATAGTSEPNRFNIERNKDGQITMLERPDRTKVQVEYKDGVAVSLKDSSGPQLKSVDGKTWTDELGLKVATQGTLTVSENGDIKIAGEKQESTTHADRTTTVTDKVKGTTTKTRGDGTAITTDAEGRVTETVDRKGGRTSYVYGTDGELSSYTDGTGKWSKQADGNWKNDANGTTFQGKRWVTADGAMHEQAQDGKHTARLLDGARQELDAQGRVTQTVDARGRTFKFEYQGDETSPNTFEFVGGGAKWRATNPEKTEWVKLGKDGNPDPSKETWSGTVEVKDGVYRQVSKSGTEQIYNSDGSQMTRVNGRIQELTNARGENYKFGYDQHGLNSVTRPDGSKANLSRSAVGGGWHNANGGGEVYGLDVDQKTGAVHETDKNWRTRQVSLDGTRTEYNFSTGDLHSTETIGGFRNTIVRNEKREIVSRQEATPDGKVVDSTAQGRMERAPDKSVAHYDRDGNLVAVDRADGNRVQIERGENGAIKKISDSKGPIVWESQDGKKFTRSGSVPLTVEGTPFVNPNGDYGFKADGRTIERTGDTLTVARPNEKVQLKDDGSSVVLDGQGKLKSSEDANGVVRSVVREKGPDGNERVSQAIVGNTLWTRSREGNQNEWTSNDGRKFTGEMQLDQDGTFRMISADKGFETISKPDGSTIFRDAAGRVHRTVSGNGAKTEFTYDDKGALSSVTMPDGKTLVRTPAKPGDKPTETVWTTQGSGELYRGDIQVDRDGRLHRKEPGQHERVRGTDGWEARTGSDGQRLFVKENPNGSTVTKNEKGQIVETRTALGSTRSYGYDQSGNLNRIVIPPSEMQESSDGGKTWTKRTPNLTEQRPAKMVLTADGELVESSTIGGKNVERVLRNDGSTLEATDGKVTKVNTAVGTEIKIGYGQDGKPNMYSNSAEGGTSWRSEDGKTWKKYSKDGKPIEGEQRPQQFELAIDRDGSVVRKFTERGEERYEVMRTDGGRTVADGNGNKISETSIVRQPDGSLKAVDATYQRDNAGKTVGRTEQKPDGTQITTDSQGRVTEAKLGNNVRRFTYEGTSRMPVAFEEGGKKFTLNKEELKQGRAIYEGEGADPNTRPRVAGLMEVLNDGSVHMIRGDKSETITRLDGSRTIKLEDGTQRTERPDGRLAEIVRRDGTKQTFKYDLPADVLGRPGQISETTIETKDGKKVTWTTPDGFHWRGSDGRAWNGFTSVDHRTGTVTDRYDNGQTWEIGMDGQKRQNHGRSFDAWGTKDATVKALDYWWQSSKIEGVRNALKDLDAEQTYMVRNAYNQGDANSLRDNAWVAFERGGDTHRWAEADGYLRRTGKPGENSAIQLAVDAQEVDRWWFNRDRSKEEILSSTRHILGSASEAERQNIDAANRSLYGQGLAEFYGQNGAGNKIANWDEYHRALIGVAVHTGADKRTDQQQADIMSAALTVPGKKLDYFMEASGKGFSTESGRRLFEQNAGADKIRYAFTTEHYTEGGGSYETQDTAAIEAATDFMQRGELRPITQFKRALGTFSNDDKAMDDALGRLKPEERAQIADGKRLFDSFKTLAPDAREKAVGELNSQQREALEQYEKWNQAFRDAHWFGKDRKAGRYEDKALVEGGTDLGKVTDIGGHWFNSHQTNAQAVENLDRKSFDQLMAGAAIGPDGQPKSQYLDRFLEAQDKNLGSGEYKQNAQQLVRDKVAYAIETNRLADSGDLDGLRSRVPQLAAVSDADWGKLKGGYQLDRQLASGAKKEGDLTADERAQLQAYREDTRLQPFMKGRDLQRQLDEVDSGARLERLKQGSALDQEVKDQKRKEADLKPDEKAALDFYRANQKEWQALDPSLPEAARAKQKEMMLAGWGNEGKAAIEAYRQGLYDGTKEGSRRSFDRVLRDAEAENGVFSSTDKKAIIDGILNMTPQERIDYHKKSAEERTAYNNRIMNALGGKDSASWKAAESLLKQIETDSSPTPAKPTMGLKEELYAKAGEGNLDRHKGFEMIRDALAKDKDGALAKKLAEDEGYRAAVTRAMGPDGYDKYVKPLMENGRLPAATLRELNTHIVSDGEGGTHEQFDQSQYFKDAFLNATPKGLASLKADPKELEQVMSSLSPEQKKIAEQILNPGNGPDGKPLEPQVRPEDRLRAFYLGAGVSKEEARDILSNLPEQERARAVNEYSRKYGSNLRQDLVDRVDNKDKDQFVRLTRTGDWNTEVAYLHHLRTVASTDSGIGAAITRDYNTMHRDALAGFEEAKREAQGNLSPEQLKKQEEAVEKAVEAFKESKEATAETVTTGIITAGALVAAPFSGGTSLYAIIAAGGVIGAGTKYALMGNDTEGFKQIAGDFVKYSALTAANVLGPEHLAAAVKLGSGAATRATTTALANAGLKGVGHEVEAQVLNGMKKLVQEGITHGGGVTDDAIRNMVRGINGLDDTAKAQLTKSLQESLASSLKAEAAQGLKGVLNSARQQGQSLVLNGVAGAGGNVIGEIGQQLIRDGKLNMEQLQMAAIMGAGFAVPIAGAMKVGGYGFRKAFGAADNLHAPGRIGDTPAEQLSGMRDQWSGQPNLTAHALAEQEFRAAFQNRLDSMPATSDADRAQNFLKAVEESRSGGDSPLAQAWRKLQAEREALITQGFDPADGMTQRLAQVQNLADQLAREMGVERGTVIVDANRSAGGVVRDGEKLYIHPSLLSGSGDKLNDLTEGLTKAVKEGKFIPPDVAVAANGDRATSEDRNAAMNLDDATRGRNGVRSSLDDLISKYSSDYKDLKWYHMITSPGRYLEAGRVRRQLERELMDEAKQVAKQLGLPEGLVTRRDLGLVNEIPGAAGSYGAKDDFLRVSAQRGTEDLSDLTPSLTLRHEMRHRAMAIERTAFAKADPEGYRSLIRDEVVGNAGKGGLRASQDADGKWVLEQRLSDLPGTPADRAITKEQAKYLRDNLDAYLKENGEALQRSGKLPNEKQMAEWLAAKTGQQADPRLVKEMVSEVNHYNVTHRTSIIPDDVVNGKKVLKGVIDARAERYREHGNVRENPKAQALVKSISDDTTGIAAQSDDAASSYYRFSVEEMRARRIEHRENLTRLTRELKTVDASDAARRADIEKAIDSYKQAIKYDNAREGFVNDLLAVRNAPAGPEQAAAVAKAQKSARDLLKMAPESDLGEVGNHAVRNGILTPSEVVAAVPENRMMAMTANLMVSDVLARPADVTRMISELPDAKARSLINGMIQSDSFTPRQVLDIVPESQIGPTAELLLKGTPPKSMTVKELSDAMYGPQQVNKLADELLARGLATKEELLRATEAGVRRDRLAQHFATDSDANVSNIKGKLATDGEPAPLVKQDMPNAQEAKPADDKGKPSGDARLSSNDGTSSTLVLDKDQSDIVFGGSTVEAKGNSKVEVASDGSGKPATVVLRDKAQADVTAPATVTAHAGTQVHVKPDPGQPSVDGLDIHLSTGSKATITDGAGRVTGSGQVEISGNNSKLELNVPEGQTMRVIVKAGDPDIKVSPDSKGRIEVHIENGREMPAGLQKYLDGGSADNPRVVMLEKADLEVRERPATPTDGVKVLTQTEFDESIRRVTDQLRRQNSPITREQWRGMFDGVHDMGDGNPPRAFTAQERKLAMEIMQQSAPNMNSEAIHRQMQAVGDQLKQMGHKPSDTVTVYVTGNASDGQALAHSFAKSSQSKIEIKVLTPEEMGKLQGKLDAYNAARREIDAETLRLDQLKSAAQKDGRAIQAQAQKVRELKLKLEQSDLKDIPKFPVVFDDMSKMSAEQRKFLASLSQNNPLMVADLNGFSRGMNVEDFAVTAMTGNADSMNAKLVGIMKEVEAIKAKNPGMTDEAAVAQYLKSGNSQVLKQEGGGQQAIQMREDASIARRREILGNTGYSDSQMIDRLYDHATRPMVDEQAVRQYLADIATTFEIAQARRAKEGLPPLKHTVGEYQSAAMMALEHNTHFNDYPTMVRQMQGLDNSIKENLRASGLGDEDYLIVTGVEPDGSSHLVTHLYGKANNIPPERFISVDELKALKNDPERAKKVLGGKRLVTLDDYRNSGQQQAEQLRDLHRDVLSGIKDADGNPLVQDVIAASLAKHDVPTQNPFALFGDGTLFPVMPRGTAQGLPGQLRVHSLVGEHFANAADPQLLARRGLRQYQEILNEMGGSSMYRNSSIATSIITPYGMPNNNPLYLAFAERTFGLPQRYRYHDLFMQDAPPPSRRGK